jgi:hypothetical protein
MKSKLTTTFALLGVLAAGTAAAAVNTQALQSRAESTIGAGTTTLIAPTGSIPASVATTSVDPATQTIQLDANVASTPATPAATKPAKKASASPSVGKVNVANATSSAEPNFGNDDSQGDDGDDD